MALNRNRAFIGAAAAAAVFAAIVLLLIFARPAAKHAVYGGTWVVTFATPLSQADGQALINQCASLPGVRRAVMQPDGRTAQVSGPPALDSARTAGQARGAGERRRAIFSCLQALPGALTVVEGV